MPTSAAEKRGPSPGLSSSGGPERATVPHVTPHPDPTILTTQQLLREVATSREVVERTMEGLVSGLTHKLEGMMSTLETQLGGMDKAIVLLQTSTDARISASVQQLQELHAEKFKSIAVQFTERDTRSEQTSRDSKIAVDAALQAAKESVSAQNLSNAMAIAKSEERFNKQIDQIGVLIDTMKKTNDDKVDDLKERLNTVEGRTNSIESQKKGGSDAWGVAIAVVGIFIGLITAIGSVLLVVIKH